MRTNLFSFASGLVFGLGLIISEMVNPARVLGFLDVTGVWDPTLAFVMAGAMVVTSVGYRWVLNRDKPIFATKFWLPQNRRIDTSLIGGAAIFGVGWGMAGLCPGPAIVGAATLNINVLLFCAAMIAGMKIHALMAN